MSFEDAAMGTKLALTILYVADLQRAVDFYDATLQLPKTVDVPVYVEYRLNEGARLGLMPQKNTRHFLGDELGLRTPGDGCPRGEIYMHVEDLGGTIARFENVGAVCTSALTNRDWGDKAAYFLDLDGYVVVVAQPITA